MRTGKKGGAEIFLRVPYGRLKIVGKVVTEVSFTEKKPRTSHLYDGKLARPHPLIAPEYRATNPIKRLSLTKRKPLEHPAHKGST